MSTPKFAHAHAGQPVLRSEVVEFIRGNFEALRQLIRGDDVNLFGRLEVFLRQSSPFSLVLLDYPHFNYIHKITVLRSCGWVRLICDRLWQCDVSRSFGID